MCESQKIMSGMRLKYAGVCGCRNSSQANQTSQWGLHSPWKRLISQHTRPSETRKFLHAARVRLSRSEESLEESRHLYTLKCPVIGHYRARESINQHEARVVATCQQMQSSRMSSTISSPPRSIIGAKQKSWLRTLFWYYKIKGCSLGPISAKNVPQDQFLLVYCFMNVLVHAGEQGRENLQCCSDFHHFLGAIESTPCRIFASLSLNLHSEFQTQNFDEVYPLFWRGS